VPSVVDLILICFSGVCIVLKLILMLYRSPILYLNFSEMPYNGVHRT
jgi:hypothetical protein